MTVQWRVPAAALLGVLLTASACDDAERKTDGPLGPQLSTYAPPLTLIEGTPPEVITVSAVIDQKGGVLKAAGHILEVPPTAVKDPTTFVMTILNNGYVETDLKAYRIDEKGDYIDIGKKGFSKPVGLKMTYDWATNISNPSKLLIAWEKEDSPHGKLEPVKSHVDSSGKHVHAELNHFSFYIMASN